MAVTIDGTSGITTPGVVNTAAETIATTLAVTGVTTVQAGTAALPAITTTGDTNTGIFFPAADTVAVSTGGTERFRINSSGNVLVGTPTAPSGVSADKFFLLTAGTSTLGAANASGYIVYTQTIPVSTATTLLTVADSTKWAGTILISYVRDVDQNRSGMKMVRFAYSQTFTTLLDSSQNSGATFSVSGNNIQVTIGGAGSYFCVVEILGGAGA
jgi:hypothetical protein